MEYLDPVLNEQLGTCVMGGKFYGELAVTGHSIVINSRVITSSF